MFDVISSSLNEKGYLQTWKSEILHRAVKPLFEAGVLKPRNVFLDGKRDDRQILKLKLLLDVLNKLGLRNTKEMLALEAGADLKELEDGRDDLFGIRPEDRETQLDVLWRICGKEYLLANDSATVPAPSEDDKEEQDKDTTEESQDPFETAVSKLEITLDNMDETKEHGEGVTDQEHVI